MSDLRNRPTGKTDDELSFAHKVWIVVGILALSVCLILILRVAFNVLLMVFAGTLIAVFFNGLGDLIQRLTKWRRRWCMLVAVPGTFLLMGLLFWFMGNTIQAQVQALKGDFPKMIAAAQTKLSQTEWGSKALENIQGYDTSKLMSTAQSFFSTSFGVIGDLYIILFLGIFFTVSPSLYKNGIIKLVPPGGKEMAKGVINRLSLVLKGWLKGMLLAMCLIATLSFIGLSILGIPMALTLALLAGLLNFIPNFGPLMAMIPAVLLGLVDSTNTAIIVAVMYILIQILESNIITPMVQKRMIDLPPALTIISQVLMGTLSGVLGILLATPILATVIVLVDELYVKRQKESRFDLD
ncbi:AI-2E family transporter [Mucilaginibacter limnophilus]|uniref:AI-2E family transporter n=1 Tax=Mucilaginibacter limnophilus TaxID=1932778 RepID=A0A437MV11_9SPHI|nr:AI-2E family transporter [Mucilaginibacter limnophilus]RVU01510.1 AI-2E family transporter [Mucilaginibacter limnophilus]